MLNYVPCQARALRIRYRIPLSELARAAGVSMQLISKIELEQKCQTPAPERMLQNAFTAIIERRRMELDALEQELSRCGGLFRTVQGDEYGI